MLAWGWHSSAPNCLVVFVSYLNCLATRHLIYSFDWSTCIFPSDPNNSSKLTTTPQGQHSKNTPNVCLWTRLSLKTILEYLQWVSANMPVLPGVAGSSCWLLLRFNLQASCPLRQSCIPTIPNQKMLSHSTCNCDIISQQIHWQDFGQNGSCSDIMWFLSGHHLYMNFCVYLHEIRWDKPGLSWAKLKFS